MSFRIIERDPRSAGRRGPVAAAAVALSLVCVLVPTTARAETAERSSSYAIAVSGGVDSNPLRLASRGESSAYGEVRFATGLKARVHPRLTLFFLGDATDRRHGAGASHADAHQANARAGLALTPLLGQSSRLAILVGARAEAHRLTFVDRATGEPFEVPSRTQPSPATEPIPGRFDTNATGAFVEVRWAVSRRLGFSLEVDRETRNHVRDYTEETWLHPLDSRAVTVTPAVRYRVADTIQLGLTLEGSDRRYESMPAYDESGAEVPGTLRRDRYLGASLSAHLDLVEEWGLELGFQSGQRRDPYSGYYDARQMGAHVTAARPLSERHRVSISLSRQDLDYETARVADDPNALLRASESLRAAARFERTLRTPGAVLAVEGGNQWTDNRDPVYAYDRTWVQTSFRFRR